jgi:hypothetical protein
MEERIPSTEVEEYGEENLTEEGPVYDTPVYETPVYDTPGDEEVDQAPDKAVYDPERSLDEQLEEYFASLESEEEEENDEGEGEPSSEEDLPAEEPPAAEPVPSQNAELEMYRKLFEDADAYAKDAMFGSMIEMIAEAKGVSVEEYRSSLGLIEPSNSQLISLKAKEDIDAINSRFPDAKLSSLEDIKNTSKYVALRDKGVSAEEAYAQVIQPKEDGKKHMTATASKTTPSRGAQMTAFEKRAARDLFPGMSDAEIQKLYKRVSK